jgi:YidC/Oxa1 family membrane protein insertase
MPPLGGFRLRSGAGEEINLSSNDSQPQSFLDTRTIISLVVMVLFFIGWQYYMQRKYPDAFRKKETVEHSAPVAANSETAKAAVDAAASKPVPAAASASVATTAPKAEKTWHYQSATLEFDISSQGMGLRDVRPLQYKDRKGEPVIIGKTESKTLILETRLMGRAESLDFNVEKVNDNLFVGHAEMGGLKITKTLEIVPDKYLLHFKVAATGQDPRFVGLTTDLIEQVDSPKKGNLLLPQLEKQEFYVDTPENRDRETFKKDDLQSSWSKVRVASIGSQYFTQAILDQSPIIPDAKGSLNHADDLAQITLQYPVLTPGQEFQLKYDAFMGPKSYSLLRSIDPLLAQTVDFGRLAFIARYIFDLLQWFYSVVGNWGWAIICLTVVVRALVLPLNIYSYKSMKSMQAIQPEMTALKERYKDDQQKANAEVMRLMRENKVNPLGGCLPMLLQFPIFIALYSVLGHTIELYQAPFIWWIRDLSLKDPYYILPVLMGVTMFLQQKTTPNVSMDPAQAKMMLMMPVVFTFFMITLPSGLTLYMLVGALFSVIQQTYFVGSRTSPLAKR